MSYADKLAIPFVLFLGEDEIAQGKCSLKDMKSGEQTLLTPEEAVASIRAALAETSTASVITEK